MSDILPADLSEAVFTSRVIDAARWHRWRVTHFRPALARSGRVHTPVQGDNGYPDLTLARRGVVIFAELKTNKSSARPSADQIAWLDALTGATNTDNTPGIDPIALSTAATRAGLAPGTHYATIWRPKHWPHILDVLTARIHGARDATEP